MTMNSQPDLNSHASKRDTSKTHTRILNAAVEIFTRHGYAGASTKSIAERAGVSEPTVFRHFGSKINLFISVVEHYSLLAELHHIITEHLTGHLRYDLEQIGWLYLNMVIDKRKGMLMILNEAEHIPEAKKASTHILRQICRSLAVYFRGQIRAGQMRDLDVEWMSQAFLGMLFAYGISHNLLSGHLGPNLLPEEIVARFVDIFLAGTTLAKETADGTLRMGLA
jgi:AcrR family transcriptional regulator